MKTKRWCKIFSVLAVLFPLAALAELNEIVIRDTSGVARHVAQLTDQEAGTVEFHISDASGQPADGAEITLKNDTTGKTLTAVSANGVVLFEGVEPGSWVVASVSPNITFTDILVSAGAAAAAETGMALVPGVIVPLAAVGAVGGGIALSNDNKKGEMSPSS